MQVGKLMIITHNMIAAMADRQLKINTSLNSKASEKLASGYKINRAADNAAGLSMSEKMRYQIRGLNKAVNNIEDGASLVKVADGALNEVDSMLHRVKELTVQAANDTNTTEDREAIQLELDQIKEETERIFRTTTFNTMPVFAKKMDFVQYTDSTQQDIVNQGTTYVTNNNYGLIKVIGESNITTAENLADRVHISGDGWTTSGNYQPYYTAKEYDKDGTVTSNTQVSGRDSSFKEYAYSNWIKNADGTYSNSSLSSVKFNMRESGSDIIFSNNTQHDISGDLLNTEYRFTKKGESIYLSSVQEKKYTQSSSGNYDSYNGKKETTFTYDYQGMGGTYVEDATYACAKIDFKGLGTDYNVSDLYNLGFASTCSHGCGRYYSVKFVDGRQQEYQGKLTNATANGVKYSESNASSYVITMDISGITNDQEGAKKLVAAIVDAANKSQRFDDHWEQYAFNSSEPTKLYLYENSLYTSSSQRSTWEPAARDEHGKQDTLSYTTGKGTIKYEENNIIHIQASYKKLQNIDIERPVMSNAVLGIDTISVGDHNYASSAIAVVDRALEYVNDKRAYLGAIQNRLEHAMKIDENTSENTQSAESGLRDTDIAKAMTEYSKNDILTQAGMSVLAQANQSTQRVISLLQM